MNGANGEMVDVRIYVEGDAIDEQDTVMVHIIWFARDEVLFYIGFYHLTHVIWNVISKIISFFKFPFWQFQGSIQDYDDCEELESNDQGGGFERSSTISDEALMQQQIGNEAGELPDYENSLQNLLRLDQTLQQLEGLLGKRMGPKRNRFKKKRLIKPSVQNISSISAISEERWWYDINFNSTFK